MVRYFYAWAPLVIVAALFILTMPWLGLIALMIVVLVALAAIAWAFVFVPYMLGRAISRRWHIHTGASPRTAPAVPLTRSQNDSVWQGAPSHVAALSVARKLETQHAYREGNPT
jgi:hypothetical protein